MKLTDLNYSLNLHKPSKLYKATIAKVNDKGRVSKMVIGEGKTEKAAKAQAEKVLQRITKQAA